MRFILWRNGSSPRELVDGHYFNLIRGNAKDPGLKEVTRGEAAEALSGDCGDPEALCGSADRRSESLSSAG